VPKLVLTLIVRKSKLQYIIKAFATIVYHEIKYTNYFPALITQTNPYMSWGQLRVQLKSNRNSNIAI